MGEIEPVKQTKGHKWEIAAGLATTAVSMGAFVVSILLTAKNYNTSDFDVHAGYTVVTGAATIVAGGLTFSRIDHHEKQHATIPDGNEQNSDLVQADVISE